MIEPGASVPAVRVWIDTDDTDDSLTLDRLSPGRPFVLLFYLYDWTGT